MPPTMDHILGSGLWLILATGFVWGVVLCLLGYLLYRIEIVFGAMQGGVYLGAVLIEHFFAKPAGVDYFIICTSLALISALLAWYVHRLMFAGLIMLMTAGVIFLFVPLGPWVYIVVGFAGLVAAVLVFFFLKQIFIFLSSLIGAAATVVCATCLILSKTPQDVQDVIIGPRRTWTLTITVTILTIGLTVAGMFSQFKLSHLVRTRLVPEAGKGGSPFVGGKMSKARLPVGKK